jgi:hypothetical protein
MSNPALNYQSCAALHPAITATGVKGFLQWMKTDPTMSTVYGQIRPQLSQLLTNNGLHGPRRGIGALAGCYCDMACCGVCSPVSCDSTTASAPTDSVGSSALVNSISDLISTGATLGISADALANANAVTTAQLQQAAAGKSPLALSSGASGQTLSGITSTGWLLILGGVVLIALAGNKT